VDDARVARVLRALRLRRGWRQRDVAVRAGVSQQLISLVERGHVEALSLAALRRIATALEVRVALRPEWRGGELDRLLDADHAAIQSAVADWLQGLAWMTAAEATFSRYGERGSIDLLAFHPAAQALVVVELKTVVADLQSLLRGLDTKVRLAHGVARGRGWPEPACVAGCLVLTDGSTNRRRVAAAAALLGRYALRGRAARAWFRRPSAAVGCPSGLLLFWNLPGTNGGGARRAGRQRVRVGGMRSSTKSGTAQALDRSEPL
jgi:transcriptional regulator with XRE-family HTH domain